MTQEVPQLRGYHSILEVVAKLKPLAEWYVKYKPQVSTLTLIRKDYDLIARWPAAAELCDFYTAQGELKYRYTNLETKEHKIFTLAFDKKAPRYDRDVPLSTSEVAQ